MDPQRKFLEGDKGTPVRCQARICRSFTAPKATETLASNADEEERVSRLADQRAAFKKRVSGKVLAEASRLLDTERGNLTLSGEKRR